MPMARIEYPESNLTDFEIYDNITWEPGLYYDFDNGFRAGAVFGVYSKSIDPVFAQGTVLSSWGVGIIGDYGYEITESGRTLMVGGMETGYGKLSENNGFSARHTNGMWAAGMGGLRYFFGRGFYMQLDYRMKWLQYEFANVPAKSYRFSGSSLRIALGYGVLSSRKNGEA